MLARSRGATSRLQAMLIGLVLVVAASGLVYSGYFVQQTGAPSRNGTVTSTSTQSTMLAFTKGIASWTTYHGNNQRTGIDDYQQSLGSVKLDWKSAVFDGAVYAEPLIIGGMVIAVTENNSVYSIDAGNGRVMWHTNLGEPVPRSELPCGNIDPTGITGTPSIDVSSMTLYLVAFLMPPHHELFAVGIVDGSVKFHRPVDPAGSDPTLEQQRGALAIANGYVYVPFGGLLGDCGDYHGWLEGIKLDGTGDPIDFQVPTGRAGGIWAPSGPSVDDAGNLFVSTGNSFSTAKFDFGNAVVKLSPELKVLDWFAPSDWSDLNAGDSDLGSVGPTYLGSNVLFQIGKSGVGYLLDTMKMGGIGGERFSRSVCAGAYGGTAHWKSTLLVPCVDGVVMLSIDLGSNSSFMVAWHGPGFNAGPPIVAGGAVWTVDIDRGTLDALSLGGGHVVFSTPIGKVAHFATPAAGDGRVYVAANKTLLAFGLNP